RIASTVSGDNIQAGGTVDFILYDTNTCSGNIKYTQRITITAAMITSGVAVVPTTNYPGGAGTAVPGNPAWSAYRIDTLLADAAGTSVNYSWKVIYTPGSTDTVHVGRQSSCTT